MTSKIDWLQRPGTIAESWNPLQDVIKGPAGRGYHCTKCSPGCEHCWAEDMNRRFGNGLPFDDRPVEFELMQDVLEKPLHWRKPRTVAVQLMGDLFHPAIPSAFQFQILQIIGKCPEHLFIILTKRTEQLDLWNYVCGCRPHPNLWLMATVCNQEEADRKIPELLRVPAVVHGVSIEPCLSAIDISPYLEYNIQKGEMSNGQRRDPLQSGTVGQVENRSVWTGLDEEESRLETGGAQTDTWISSGQEDDQSCAASHRSTSPGLSSLQGANSSRHDHQSHKREEGRQQTREPRAGNLFRTNEACIPSGSEESRWAEEPRQQIDRSSGARHQKKVRTRGNNSDAIRSGIRRCISDNLEDSERRTASSTGGRNSRLHQAPNQQDKETECQGAIQFVIVGGESGPGARPMHPDWVRRVRNDCQDVNVPFFFKQWGEWKPENQGGCFGEAHMWDDGGFSYKSGKKLAGHLLDGKEYHEWPR